MYINWQTIITIGGVLSALLLIFGLILKVHKWYLAQNEQSKEIIELREKHTDDIQHIKICLYVMLSQLVLTDCSS